MKKLRLSILSLTVAGIIAIASSGVANAASYGINVNEACYTQYYGDYRSYLVSQTVVGWRCRNSVYSNQSVDMNFYCSWKYPGTHSTWSNYNDPYSWKCSN